MNQQPCLCVSVRVSVFLPGSLFLSPSLPPLCLSLPLPLSHSLSLTHTYRWTHKHTLFLSCSFSFSLSLSQTHIHLFVLTISLSISLSTLYLSHSLTASPHTLFLKFVRNFSVEKIPEKRLNIIFKAQLDSFQTHTLKYTHFLFKGMWHQTQTLLWKSLKRLKSYEHDKQTNNWF